ncbi:hypothetical protein FOL47_003873 [Perkinsus chesapeaki]|uniref:Uncharacterized protein n=1 Tax=Perkinsus chesapeaki TaxID=330153 RepID=A0A7J6M5N6_PERCH|nr:hypothetical protein FOL47_003873 [Perkinsus chesapeaki]
MSSANITAAAAAAAAAASTGHRYHGYHGGGSGGNILVSVPGSLKAIVHSAKTMKTAESERRDLVIRSLKSHGVDEYTEEALDLLCALLSHEVQDHLITRKTLPTNALTIPSGDIVDAMTSSTLALDKSLPRSDNRYNDAFLPQSKKQRGQSDGGGGDVLDSLIPPEGMSIDDEIVSGGINSDDGGEYATASLDGDSLSIDNSIDY